MRNLKKVLSLVLVVAMLASMMIVGAAAADTEKTNYEEAAAVIAGIGVMEGDENGMRYGDTVTREEAAAIICRVLLGDTAETLKTTTAPFADVAASRWSAGYIAYLKNQGIVSGVSDTEFDPTAKVTGIAFAKMLLTAVGYGKAGEFEGAQWDINTITFANDNGIFTDTKAADLAVGATREECMLYAFNTLTKVPTVKYNKTFESYYTGTSALNPVTGDVIPTNTGANDPYAYTLAWTKYELKQDPNGAIDAFGRPAASWTADGVIVANAVANVEPTAVFKGTVQSYLLYPVLGKTVVTYLNSHKGNVTQYIDGVLQGTTVNGVFNTTTPIVTDIVAGEFTNPIGGEGAVVELYLTQVNGAYYLRVVTTNEYFGEVQRVTTTGTPTLSILGENATADGEEIDITGYKKGDYVIYTKGADGIATLKPAEYITATFTANNALLGTYTLDGVSYKLSANNKNVDGVINTYGSSYNLYLDSLGNIIYAELAAEGENANQYVYVALAEGQGYIAGALNGQDAKLALTVVYPNGGTEVLYHAVKSVKSGNNTYYYVSVAGVNYAILDDGRLDVMTKQQDGTYTLANAPAAANNVITGWYRYSTNDVGNVTLKALNAGYAQVNNVTLATGKATTGITGYAANSATILTKVDLKGNVVTYTGISNFVDVNNAPALVTYGYNSKVVKSITVIVDAISSNMNLAYCTGSLDSTADGTPYMFYIDGELKIFTSDTATAIAGNIYNIDVNDGEYTFELVGGYNNNLNDADDKGTVNAGYAMDPFGTGVQGTDLQKYGVMNFRNFTYTYYEWATVDTVDSNFFTTVAVELVDVPAPTYDGQGNVTNQAAIDEANAKNTAILDDSVGGIAVDSHTYYFDGNTKIYDCTGAGQGKLVDTISAGDVFVAYVDEDASTVYSGEAYVSYIWIVG